MFKILDLAMDLKTLNAYLRVFVAMVTHHDQKQLWRGKDLLGFHVSIAVSQEGKPGQKLKARTWRQELMQGP